MKMEMKRRSGEKGRKDRVGRQKSTNSIVLAFHGFATKIPGIDRK